MSKIDVRRHSSPAEVHYEPLAKKVFSTDIARLRAITPDGRVLLAKAPQFCRMERALIARLVKEKPIKKPQVMAEFGFPGRMFNAALDTATGLVESATTLAHLALETTRERLCRGLAHYMEAGDDPSRTGELNGRRRNLLRLLAQEARQEKRLLHPKIFPGGDHYYDQRKGTPWKKAYRAKRSDHLSANGGADERCGNQTFQITLGATEMIGARLWQTFHLKHSGNEVATFRSLHDNVQGLIAAVQANAQSPKRVDVEVWRDGAGKRISPAQQRRMQEAGLVPASTQTIKRASPEGRIGLTIDFRRHKGRHWYIHVSREEKALPKPALPTGWMGIDLNCDSIASAVVTVDGGRAVLESYHKAAFPKGGLGGARRTILCTEIRRLVDEAQDRSLGISLEYLDFESSKKFLKSKLGAMLRAMPYRQIRRTFERRCLETGVPFRYVPPKYSSLVGAVLSSRWPQLGRDQAAAAVLSLRASEKGNLWLEAACEQAVLAERTSLRLNAKGLCGHTVTVEHVDAPPPQMGNHGRQMDRPRYPVEPAFKWQVACGRMVSDAFSTLRAFRVLKLPELRRAAKARKRIPNARCLRFEMPPVIKLPRQNVTVLPLCSSLIKEA